jgi:uncharacterized protein YgbK (DUF1537 family)
MQRIIAIADDLSGAAETAAGLLAAARTLISPCAPSTHNGFRGQSTADDGGPQVRLLPHRAEDLASHLGHLPPDAALLVLDTDNRRFPAELAAGRLRQVLDALPAADDPSVVFLKIDSLLRGPVASQLSVLAEGGPVILAPALPPLGRSTVNGTIHHQGVPLHQTALWHAEPSAPPETIAGALHPLATVVVDLATVRSGTELLTAALTAAFATRPVPVVICDAETLEDLDAIACSARGIPGVRFAGASALGAALARTAGQAPSGTAAVVRSLHARKSGKFPLLVVGSASGPAREQLHNLAGYGVPVVALLPADLLDGTPDIAPLEKALQGGPAAVTVDASAVDAASSSRIAAALAQAVAPLAEDRPLMLTGGETARSVLDALGVQRLDVLGEIEHGAVLSLTPAGMPVVTRPGSFGSPDSLRIILSALSSYPEPLAAEPSPAVHTLATAPQPSLPRKGPSMNNTDPAELPYVAVTMGDGAGVGPEVVVAAVLDPQSNAECRPVVIGDALRLRQAADLLGIEADIRSIENVEDAVFTPGRVNVIDLALLPEDLPWGQLSARGRARRVRVHPGGQRAGDGREGAGHLHRAAEQGGAALGRAHLPRAH